MAGSGSHSTRPRAAGSRSSASAAEDRLGFIGRRAELAQVVEFLHGRQRPGSAVFAGRETERRRAGRRSENGPGALIIEGPAGIGKRRLAREAAGELNAVLRIFSGAEASEGVLAWFIAAISELGGLELAGQDRTRLLLAWPRILRSLERAGAVLVLLIPELQALPARDLRDLEGLLRLIDAGAIEPRNQSARRIRVILTRDPEAARPAALALEAALLDAARPARLSLGPIIEAEDLAGRWPQGFDQAQLALRLSEGRPLDLQVLADQNGRELRPIARWITERPALQRRLLCSLALIAQPLSRRCLAALIHEDEAALEIPLAELIRDGLVREPELGLALRHPALAERIPGDADLRESLVQAFERRPALEGCCPPRRRLALYQRREDAPLELIIAAAEEAWSLGEESEGLEIAAPLVRSPALDDADDERLSRALELVLRAARAAIELELWDRARELIFEVAGRSRAAELGMLEISATRLSAQLNRKIRAFETARRCLFESLESARRADCVAGQSRLLRDLASVSGEAGRWAEAIGYYQECLDFARSLGDNSGEARYLRALANAFIRSEQRERALDPARRAHALSRATDDQAGASRAAGILAELARLRGDSAAAIPHHREAIAGFEAIGDGPALAQESAGLAECLELRGDRAGAGQAYERVIALVGSEAPTELFARARSRLCVLAFEQLFEREGQAGHQLRDLLPAFNEVTTLWNGLGDRRRYAIALLDLGVCYREVGALDRARACFDAAIRWAASSENPAARERDSDDLLLTAYTAKARLLSELGADPRAHALLERFDAPAAPRPGSAAARLLAAVRAHILARLGRRGEAAALLADPELTRFGEEASDARAWIEAGKAALVSGDLAQLCRLREAAPAVTISAPSIAFEEAALKACIAAALGESGAREHLEALVELAAARGLALWEARCLLALAQARLGSDDPKVLGSAELAAEQGLLKAENLQLTDAIQEGRLLVAEIELRLGRPRRAQALFSEILESGAAGPARAQRALIGWRESLSELTRSSDRSRNQEELPLLEDTRWTLLEDGGPRSAAQPSALERCERRWRTLIESQSGRSRAALEQHALYRRLRQLIEAQIADAEGDELRELVALKDARIAALESAVDSEVIPEDADTPGSARYQEGQLLQDFMRGQESRFLRSALSHHKDNKSRTAKALGISRYGLLKKLDRYGLRKPKPKA